MPVINACSTLGFSLSPIEVALEHISNYGFSSVEIADMFTHCKHFSIDDVNPEEIRTLLDKFSLKAIAANISMAVFDTGGIDFQKNPVETQSAEEVEEIKIAKSKRFIHKLHVDEQAEHYIARFKKMIKKAHIAGIPKVCIQSGRRMQVQDIEHELKAAAGVIDTISDHALQYGIKVLLEMPHVWDIYFDIDKAQKMWSYLNSENVGVLIDSTHWHVAGYDIDQYLDFLGERLWHVHLRDAAGQDSSVGAYELEKTPGKGEVDFAKLAKSLDRHGYKGDVSLETEYKYYKDAEEVDIENRFALQYLRDNGWETEGQ